MTQKIDPRHIPVSQADTEVSHIPVLLAEVLQLLDLHIGDTVIDTTLGLGGYTRALAQAVGPSGQIISLDADERNLHLAKERLRDFSNIVFCHSNFRFIDTVIDRIDPRPTVHSIVFDLGLSSPHIDQAERGFAYQKDGPLDMRFDSTQGKSAAQIINTSSESDLSHLLREYGDEPAARKITQAIIARREGTPFQTTFELRECIEQIIPERFVNQTLKRVFQALRIAVNDEMAALTEALTKAFTLLSSGGTIAVVTYHSLEEKIVKNFFQNLTSSCICPPILPKCVCGYPKAKSKTHKAITPTDTELTLNPRSRSARLRAIQKI